MIKNKGYEYIFSQGKPTSGQPIYEKVLVIKNHSEIHIKTTMSYNLTSVRITIIKSQKVKRALKM
jgi:hypothetical protein